MAVAVQISRSRKTSTKPVTREVEHGDLKMGDTEVLGAVTELEASYHATTDELDNIPLNTDITK